MKIKKSSILLIVMAIFLLISIGSACASENITDDSDMSLAEDNGESVVLSNTNDTVENVPDDTNEKINTTIETESDTYKFSHDSDKNISVKVKANGSNIAVNKSNLSVFEGNATINFDYDNNNTIIAIKELAVGNHTLTINYLGNDIYANATKIVTVQVFGNNTIETETSVVTNGENIEIPVKVNDGVEYIELIKNNFNLTLVYTNESGNISNLTIRNFVVEDGKIKFNNSDNGGQKLIAASLIIDYANATEPKTVGIKISTAVKAEITKDKFESEEIKNISSIKIYDGQGNLINVTNNDLKVFENGNAVDFSYDPNTTVMNLTLGIGVHNLTIVYQGDETYNSSSASALLKVGGPLRFSPSECVALDESKTATITINLNDGADPVDINKTKLNVTLFYKVGNKTSNRTIETFELNGQDISFTVNENFDSAYADIKYSENNLTGKTIIKVGTIITASDAQFAETEVKNLTVEVKGTDGNNINITKDNIQVLKDGKALTIEVNNSVVTIKDALKFGAYNLTVKYLGTDKYIASNKTVILNVYGINATKTANINSTKKGNVNVTVIVGNETKDINIGDLTLNVTYKNGNDTVVVKIVDPSYANGTLSFTLENGNFTTATLNIKYNNTETNVTLNRIFNAKIEVLTDTNQYKTGNFTFRLVDLDDGSNITGKSVKLSNVGNVRVVSSATTDANGIARFRTTSLYVFDSSFRGETLPVGVYAYEVESEGNVKATKVSTNLTVVPAKVKITIDPYKEYYGSTKNVMIHVVNSENEPVSNTVVRLDIADVGTYYMYTNASGIAQISLYSKETKKGLVGGDYKFTASNNDTKNIVNTSAKATVTILKIPVVINAKDVSVYYDSYSYTIKVTKDGKTVSGVYLIVRIYTTSSKYEDYLFQTNSKGTVSIGAPLDVGKHKIIINSADNRYEAKQVTKTITVKKASATIKAPKVTDYYKGTKTFKIKLVNSKNKKAMYYSKLNVKIYVSKNRYYNYDGVTQADGYIRLSLNTLKPGSYKVEVTGKDKKNFDAKKVTSKIVIKKAPAKLSPKKLTAKKGAKKYFKVTVKNKKTKKVITGVKVKIKVYTGKKAKTYTAKTNSKGIAKISTKKLKVGKHKVVVTSGDKYVTAKKAKSTIKITK